MLHLNRYFWTSLLVQWLRLLDYNVEGSRLIPFQGTKIPHAVWHSQKKVFFKAMNRYIQINIIFPGDQAVEAPTQGYDEGGSENRL